MRRLLEIVCMFSVTVTIFPVASTGGQDTCIDLETNKKYAIGQNWTEKGQCIKYKCEETSIPDLPGVTVAATTKYICTEPKPADDDNRNCFTKIPFPNEPYPKCCQHLICNRPGRVEVVRPKYD